MAESNNWSELPVELLFMVDQRLFKLKDIIRFRATCKPWRRSLNSVRGKFRQSLPWLMLPYCSGDANSMMAEGCKGSDCCRRFFDVAEQKFHHIVLPQGLDKTTCRGSAFGWMLTLQRTPFMFLLNPLTGNQIPLPPLTSFPDVLKYRPEKIGYEYLWVRASGRKIASGKKFLESSCIYKMALSADPVAEEDFVVMVIRCGLADNRLAFCRPRDEEAWTLIPRPGPYLIAFTDVVFWRSQFYVLDNLFRLFICDISIAGHPRLRLLIDSKNDTEVAENYYLSVSPTGDELMMVTRKISHPEDEVAVEDVDEGEGEDDDGDNNGYINPVDHGVVDDEADIVAPDEDSDDERCVDPGVSLDRMVHRTIRFEVFKLNEDTKEWDEVGSIGDYALFLGFNTSTCVSARDHPEIVPNSIYFTDDMLEYHYKKLLGGFDMGIFSLSTGFIQPLYDARSVHNNPSFISPFPVWFLPSNF